MAAILAPPQRLVMVVTMTATEPPTKRSHNPAERTQVDVAAELKRAAMEIGEPAVGTTWVQPMRPVMALMMIAMAEQMKALRVPVGIILDVAPKGLKRVMTVPGGPVAAITSVQVKRRVTPKMMIVMVGQTKAFADRVVAV